MLEIFLVNYGENSNPSGRHINAIASGLKRRGVPALIFVNDNSSDLRRGERSDVELRRLSAQNLANAALEARLRGRKPLIHVWTTRECVRSLIASVNRWGWTPYIVHLEDNELHLAARAMEVMGGDRPPPSLTDPAKFGPFLGKAIGVTYIVDSLEEFCPPGKPRLMFWPACEVSFFDLAPEPQRASRAKVGLARDDFVVFYPGNTHFAIRDDVAALYRAAAAVHSERPRVKLLRAGVDHIDPDRFSASPERPWLVHVGPRPSDEMPELMALCDAVIQPGQSGAFDDYRFPSKLPMSMAAARPIVLPDANIGRRLRNEQDCVLLATGEADEIAVAIRKLEGDPQRCRMLGLNARAFARKHLNWDRTVERLIDFYARLS